MLVNATLIDWGPVIRKSPSIPADQVEYTIAHMTARQHDVGIYEVPEENFNFNMLLNGVNNSEWEDYCYDLNGFCQYGVCDSIEQWKETDVACFVTADPDHEYCVSFTHVSKVPGEEGGWRWHKWGPYIGNGKPTCEYLADEEKFDNGIYVFHVYRRKIG